MQSPILSTISSTIVKKVRFFLTDEQLQLQKEKYYWCSGCGKRYRNKRCFTIDFKEPSSRVLFKKPIKRETGLYCHINCTYRNAVRECMDKMIEHVEIYAILDSIIEEIQIEKINS